MASSKTTTKKTATKKNEKPAEPVAMAKRKPVAIRRVPVQYTPRIPTTRCLGC